MPSLAALQAQLDGLTAAATLLLALREAEIYRAAHVVAFVTMEDLAVGRNLIESTPQRNGASFPFLEVTTPTAA